MYKLGIDVGGTNTDAVLVDENRAVVADIKYPTSADIYDGILGAMRTVLEVSGVDPKQIGQAMLAYTMDNKDWFPGGTLHNKIYYELAPYTGIAPDKYKYKPWSQRKIWACPADSYRARKYVPGEGYVSGSYGFSYYARNNLIEEDSVSMIKISLIKQPSKLIYGMDTEDLRDGKALVYTVIAATRWPFKTDAKGQSDVHFRHSGNASTLWFDGHSNMMRLPDCYGTGIKFTYQP